MAVSREPVPPPPRSFSTPPATRPHPGGVKGAWDDVRTETERVAAGIRTAREALESLEASNARLAWRASVLQSAAEACLASLERRATEPGGLVPGEDVDGGEVSGDDDGGLDAAGADACRPCHLRPKSWQSRCGSARAARTCERRPGGPASRPEQKAAKGRRVWAAERGRRAAPRAAERRGDDGADGRAAAGPARDFWAADPTAEPAAERRERTRTSRAASAPAEGCGAGGPESEAADPPAGELSCHVCGARTGRRGNPFPSVGSLLCHVAKAHGHGAAEAERARREMPSSSRPLVGTVGAGARGGTEGGGADAFAAAAVGGFADLARPVAAPRKRKMAPHPAAPPSPHRGSEERGARARAAAARPRLGPGFEAVAGGLRCADCGAGESKRGVPFTSKHHVAGHRRSCEAARAAAPPAPRRNRVRRPERPPVASAAAVPGVAGDVGDDDGVPAPAPALAAPAGRHLDALAAALADGGGFDGSDVDLGGAGGAGGPGGPSGLSVLARAAPPPAGPGGGGGPAGADGGGSGRLLAPFAPGSMHAAAAASDPAFPWGSPPRRRGGGPGPAASAPIAVAPPSPDDGSVGSLDIDALARGHARGHAAALASLPTAERHRSVAPVERATAFGVLSLAPAAAARPPAAERPTTPALPSWMRPEAAPARAGARAEAG